MRAPSSRNVPMVCSLAAAAAIFILDVLTPFGYVASMLYVLPVLLTWLVPGRQSSLLLAGGALVLSWVATLLSPEEFYVEAIANRTTASALLLIVTVLLVNQKQLAQKAAVEEEARHESEEQLRIAFDISSIGMWQAELWTGRLLRVNQRFCEMTGYVEAELLSRPFSEVTHPEDRAANLEGYLRLVRGQCAEYRGEKRYVRKDGGVIWVDITVNLVRDLSARPLRTVAVIRDITERKQASEALRKLNDELERRVAQRAAELIQANERFEWVARATHDGVYDWDLPHDSINHSPSWKKMHGFRETEFPEPADAWSTRLHPEDRERVLGRLQDYLAGRQLEFWEEYRVRRKDGTTMWVLNRAVAQRDEQGKAVRLVGAETDITWRKQAEEAVRRREQEFATLADHVPALFSYVDRDRRYRFVNTQYGERFGRSREEIVGLTVRDLWGPEGYAKVQPHLDVALGGQEVSFEYRLPGAGGSEHWFSARYVPDRNEDGKVAGLYAMHTDVTALKSSEAALREREDQLRNLSAKLLQAHEEERRRIARELHDDITQRLAALAIELDSLGHGSAGAESPAASRLPALREMVSRLTADLRRLAYGLHPSIIEHAGLEAAFREYTEEFARQTGLATEIMTKEVPNSIPLDRATCLYRVLQESLQNVRKHAQASNVLIRLLGTGHGVGVCVHDDGRGFAPTDKLSGRLGLGLTSMRERVELLKGTFRIRSKPDEGTEVHAWVPLGEVKRDE